MRVGQYGYGTHLQVDAVLGHVVAIDERTVALEDLPQQLQAGLADIGKRLKGLSTLVMEVGATHTGAEGPATLCTTHTHAQTHTPH